MKTQTKKSVEQAKSEIKEASKHHFKKKPRVTVQVRIGKKWHRKLKKYSRSEKKLISSLMDDICSWYFANNQ